MRTQKNSARHGRTILATARITAIGSVLMSLVAESGAGNLSGPASDPPCAQLPQGTIAIGSPASPANVSHDHGLGPIETASEAAGDVVATVLKTPSLGNHQLEAAVGVVQFAFAPIAAGYGALRGAHHKLTPEQLADAEGQLE